MKQIKAVTISDASEHVLELMMDAFSAGDYREPFILGSDLVEFFVFDSIDVEVHIMHPSACCNTFFVHNVFRNFVMPLRSIVSGVNCEFPPKRHYQGADFYQWSTQTFPYIVYSAMYNSQCIPQTFRISNPRLLQEAMSLAQWDDGWANHKTSWVFEGPFGSDTLMALDCVTGIKEHCSRKLVSPMAQAFDALQNDEFDKAERAANTIPEKFDWGTAARKYMQFLRESQHIE